MKHALCRICGDPVPQKPGRGRTKLDHDDCRNGTPRRDLLDALAAQQRKTTGQGLALNASAPWVERAMSALGALARRRHDFTADDLVRLVGLPHDVLPNHNNAVGAVFSKAARARLIRATGAYTTSRRPESHGRIVRVWRGVR